MMKQGRKIYNVDIYGQDPINLAKLGKTWDSWKDREWAWAVRQEKQMIWNHVCEATNH